MLFLAFQPVKILHLPHRGQAFLEFPSPAIAQQAVDYATSTALSLGGRSVKVSKRYHNTVGARAFSSVAASPTTRWTTAKCCRSGPTDPLPT